MLGSIHFLHGHAIDNPDDADSERLPVEALWSDYLEQLVDAAESGLYDVMSHPDLPKVFGRRIPPALERLLDDAVAAIAATGVAIECSSAGLRKPIGEIYPEPGLLARFRRAGVPATLSSDAHAPEDVAPRLPDRRRRAARGGVRDDHPVLRAASPSRCRCDGDEGGHGRGRPPLRPGEAPDARDGAR